jgi:hypothetical protein
MFPRDVSRINTQGMRQRDAVKAVTNFMTGNTCRGGRIFVLYGLRRTGKTTIMEQALEQVRDELPCAFYEMTNGDSIQDVFDLIVREEEKGTKVLCLDEITKVDRFIQNSSVLPDIFAKDGMRIILTGTDSLGFYLASNELFDRTVTVSTTYISPAEHFRVLGTSDIDDYIRYGGLVRKGGEKPLIHDQASAVRYLDEAVSQNIANSIAMSKERSSLRGLESWKISKMLNILAEYYNGKFTKELFQEEMDTFSLLYPNKKAREITDRGTSRALVLESADIQKDFLSIINADGTIQPPVTEDMIRELKNDLMTMDVLSGTARTVFQYTKETGWQIQGTDHEYYLIQPAVKYWHLVEGAKFIDSQDYYKDFTADQKDFIKQKLEEKTMGDMLEQIVLFDTVHQLDPEKYTVVKPEFFAGPDKKGEYDMLVRNRKKNCYWAFEVKHSMECVIGTEEKGGQEKHLVNPGFRSIIDHQYGTRAGAFVLYRGESMDPGIDIPWLNVTDFSISLARTKNLEATIAELTTGLDRGPAQESTEVIYNAR